MNRRCLLNALVIPLLEGCMPPGSQTPGMERPPVGTVTADAAYPAIGMKWKVRTTESGIFQQAVEDVDVTATQVDFNGRRGYGLASRTATLVLDPSSFNTMGTIDGGKVATTYTPEVGPFAWPLWVGKSWEVTYSYADLVYGRVWPVAKSQMRVAAFEDVTVPAGTFKAFRIEYKGGIGSSTSGGRREQSLSGIESNDIYWYAPGIKIVVKSMIERLGSHYRGVGRTTTELLALPR